MNRILELAKLEWSAGDTYIGPDIRSLERFAALIEAEEREACAAKAARMVNGKSIAAAIRARGRSEQ